MSANQAPDVARPAPLPAVLTGRRDVCGLHVAKTAETTQLGRDADSPLAIPWAGWRRVLRRTAREIVSDRISLVAAGCAFYGTLALFPAISMLVSIYGLAFDPVTVEPQLVLLQDLLPPMAFRLIEDRVHELVSRPQMALTLSLTVSTAVTWWSAATGTKSILAALNMAYEEQEARSFVRFQVTAFAMTLVALLGAAFGLALLVGMPTILAVLGVMTRDAAVLVQGTSLGLLLAFVVASLAVLYRFGPSRQPPRWRWVIPGAVTATVLWLAASLLFSFYVGHLSSYDAMYGSLGSVVGVMMWFYVTGYVVLLGAELNAELELQTARDSTHGPVQPLGRRGAYVADHVARH